MSNVRPNKPRNLRYFGDDKPAVAGVEKKPEEPHRILGIETRPLLAAAAMLGVAYWAFTHDPIANFGEVPGDGDDEDSDLDKQMKAAFNADTDDDAEGLGIGRLEDDWLLDSGKTSKSKGFRAGGGAWKGVTDPGPPSMPRTRRPDPEMAIEEEEAFEEGGDDEPMLEYDVTG